MTVGELTQRMDAREFGLWKEFFWKEPFGQEWERSALIAGAVVKSKDYRKLLPQNPDPDRYISAKREQAARRTAFALGAAFGIKMNID